MNATMLLLSSTLVAGADPVPAAAPAAPAPVVVQSAPTWPSPAYGVPGGGCSSCGTGICPGTSDPCPCEPQRRGLLSRLCNRDSSNDCDCSPRERRRLFHGFTTSACDDGCDNNSRGGLFSRLRARFHGGDDCCDPCGSVSHYGSYGGCSSCGNGCGTGYAGSPAVGGCALPPVPGSAPAALPQTAPAPLPPAEAPKPMAEPAKEAPKPEGTTNVSHKLAAPAPLPVPAIPVLTDSKSPF